jgi:hypothetical protein
VATDPAKVEAINNWPIPKTITQLRGFLDLAGYYRRFIHGYGLLCRPLHELLKKDSFQWTPKHTSAFQELKQNMTSAPVLSLPKFTLPFTLETNSSGLGIGAMLMQQGRSIVFYSQALGPRAVVQSTYHKEGLAILEAFKKWRHYFLGGHLIIKIDQQRLKHMISQRLTEGIQHKLMLKLLEFSYSIEYKKGIDNAVANALSRKDAQILAISSIVPSCVSDIEQSYQDDPHFKAILEQTVVNDQSVPHYTVHTSILRYKGKLCIGALVSKLRYYHPCTPSLIDGHSGIRVTYQRIKRLFYWPKLKLL